MMGHASFFPHTFDNAETVIAAGRNKIDRMVDNHTYLSRVDDDTIALVFHKTAVVTYHRDGTQTLWRNGWTSKTTHERINGYSAARMWKHDGVTHVSHADDERTPDNFIPCRSRKSRDTLGGCKGTGQVRYEKWCHPRYCNEAMWGDECSHGNTSKYGHSMPCEHGNEQQHLIGIASRDCYRCKGTGQENIGDCGITYQWGAFEAIRIDATGKVLGSAPVPKSPAYVGMTYKPKPFKPYEPSEEVFPVSMSGYGTGGNKILADNTRLFPGLNTRVRSPITNAYATIATIIIELNDSAKWSRERIADWLDTLDVDLRMQHDA